MSKHYMDICLVLVFNLYEIQENLNSFFSMRNLNLGILAWNDCLDELEMKNWENDILNVEIGVL